MTKSTITREPITHDLKIYPEFFSAVCTGVKRAELRKNDRDYRVGDTLHLMETPRGSCHQTGEFINVKITHIADVGEWMPGYVLLSVELQERRKADSEPVAEVVSIYGDPEAFGEREIRPLVGIQQMPYGTKLYRHAQSVPVVSADLLHTAASAIEDLLTTKDRTGACVWFDLPFRLRSAANAQPAPVVPEKCPAEIRDLIDSHSDALFNDDDAQEIWNACRATMLQASPVCTCPSGDGSLRWPCPVHPGNSLVIPDGSASMLRRWLAFGRGMQNAGCQLPHNLIVESEAMLAAAPQEVKGE